MNKLIIIGFMGGYAAYLNLTEEEALDRYCKQDWPNGLWEPGYETREQHRQSLRTLEFVDEFGVYDISKTSPYL